MTERELFEKWLKVQSDYNEISGYERIVMWKAWQASASRGAEIDGLQKRIDNSLKVFEESNLSSLEQIEKVYGILKG